MDSDERDDANLLLKFHAAAAEHHLDLSAAHEACAKAHDGLSGGDADAHGRLAAAHARISEAHRGLSNLHTSRMAAIADSAKQDAKLRRAALAPVAASVVGGTAPADAGHRVVPRDSAVGKLFENDEDAAAKLPAEIRKMVE